METSEILQESPQCDTDSKWANAVGKTAPVDLLYTGLPQTFNLKKKTKTNTQLSAKHNKAMCNKTRHAYMPKFMRFTGVSRFC